MKRLAINCAAREGDYLTIIQHTDPAQLYEYSIVVRSEGQYITRAATPAQIVWLGQEIEQALAGVPVFGRECGAHYLEAFEVHGLQLIDMEAYHPVVAEGLSILASVSGLTSLARDLFMLVLDAAYDAPYVPAVAAEGDH